MLIFIAKGGAAEPSCQKVHKPPHHTTAIVSPKHQARTPCWEQNQCPHTRVHNNNKQVRVEIVLPQRNLPPSHIINTVLIFIKCFFNFHKISPKGLNILYLQGWVRKSQVVKRLTSHCPTLYHQQKEASDSIQSLRVAFKPSQIKGARGRDPSPRQKKDIKLTHSNINPVVLPYFIILLLLLFTA